MVENHALVINRFMTAQTCGEPIQYVSVEDNEKKSKEVDKLNRMMSVLDKPYFDIQIGDWQSTGGTAYRDVWSKRRDEVDDEEPLLGMDAPDPRYNFIVYSSKRGREKLMSVSICENENNEQYYLCTTPTTVFEIIGDRVGEGTPNGY